MAVRKNTVAEELIDGFAELAEALEAGGDLGAQYNCYQMQLDLRPKTYTLDLVRDTRKLLGASQAVFAKFLGVSPKTVQHWEHGFNVPKPVACRFMDEIRRNPKYYINRIRESAVPKTGKKKKPVKAPM